MHDEVKCVHVERIGSSGEQLLKNVRFMKCGLITQKWRGVLKKSQDCAEPFFYLICGVRVNYTEKEGVFHKKKQKQK